MKIQEADAKSLLVAQGLPVPPWEVAHTPAEAREAAERFFAAGAQQVVIKAQVLVGGRGKAGGVRLASDPAEAEAVAGAILGMDIKGITVRKVLVAPAADIVSEIASQGARADFAPSREWLVARIAEEAQAGDLVLVMGARDPSLSALARAILAAIDKAEAPQPAK